MAFIILFYFFSAIHISFWFVCVAAVVEGFILFGFRGLKTIGNALDAPRCDAMRCESVCYRFNLIRLFRFVYLSILSEIEKHTYPNHTHTDTHTQACTRALPCLVACLVSRIAHTPRASKTMWGEPKWNHNICQAAERNAPHDIAKGGSPTLRSLNPFHVFPFAAPRTSWRMRNVPVRLHVVRLFIIQPVCNSCSPAAHKFFPWNRQCTSDTLSTVPCTRRPYMVQYKGWVERKKPQNNLRMLNWLWPSLCKVCAPLLLTTIHRMYMCMCRCMLYVQTYACLIQFGINHI